MSSLFSRIALLTLVVSFSLGLSSFLPSAVAAAPLSPAKATGSTGNFGVHTATTANSFGDSTLLNEHPFDNNPLDLYQVAATWNTKQTCGCVYDTHTLGVWYTGQYWAIFHEDGTAIPVGATYNVVGYPAQSTTDGDWYLHSATTANTSGNSTILNDTYTNNNPQAVIVVTQNWTPSGICGCKWNKHLIGVWYNNRLQRWEIFNEDGSAMPVGAAFNVDTWSSSGTRTLTQQATTSSYISYINNVATNNAPNSLLFVTPNWATNGICGCVFSNHPIGVYYQGNEWSIFNQDIAAMPIGAAFNVMVFAA